MFASIVKKIDSKNRPDIKGIFATKSEKISKDKLKGLATSANNF